MSAGSGVFVDGVVAWSGTRCLECLAVALAVGKIADRTDPCHHGPSENSELLPLI